MKQKFFRSVLAIGMIAAAPMMNSCNGNDDDPQKPIDPEAETVITLKTETAIGEQIDLYIDAEIADRDKVWIDLNNDGVQQPNEKVANFGNGKKYVLEAQTIAIYGKVKIFSCAGNKVTALDVSKNIELITLECGKNQLQVLDVSKNTELITLGCVENQLQALDVSKNTKLKELYCNENQLQVLDVSKNTKLKELYCNKNQLKTLDVSKNTELEVLECYTNQLQVLDVSKNTKLKSLICAENELKSLNVSKNTELGFLPIAVNQIKKAGMNALLNSLPQRNTSDKAKIYIQDTTVANEGNELPDATYIQKAKDKNWKVFHYKDEEWAEL